jgi:hypothetical protein
VIRKCGGSLQVQGSPAATLTDRKRWLSRQIRGQTKPAWPEAKKVEAQLPKQLDRGEQHCSRTRTVGEQVERWLEWRQQVRSISPVTVANYPGRDRPLHSCAPAAPNPSSPKTTGIAR